MDLKNLAGLYEAYMNVYDESEDVEEIDEAKEDEGLTYGEKRKKRNERLGMSSRERKNEHRWARGERGNYGIENDRYQPTKGHEHWNKGLYPSVRIKGRGFNDSLKKREVKESYDNFDSYE